MAATHALITAVCSAGDHVVLPSDLYGGTFRLVDKVLTRFGITYTLVDQTDLDALAAAVTRSDQDGVGRDADQPLVERGRRARGARRRSRRRAVVAVDNTFATPVNQRPLELGADAAVHSVTKYLGGHSDTVGGAVVVRDPGVHERCVRPELGRRGPGPFDCFLVHRGLRTLQLRMAAHAASAEAVVGFLRPRPASPTSAGRASAAW